MPERIWVSALPERPVRAGERTIGKVADCVIRLLEVGNPPLTGIVIEPPEAAADPGRRALFVPARFISRLDGDGALLDRVPDRLDAFERRPGEILIMRDLLDHNVIDVRSRLRPRLIRAEDAILGTSSANTASWRRRGARTGYLAPLRAPAGQAATTERDGGPARSGQAGASERDGGPAGGTQTTQARVRWYLLGIDATGGSRRLRRRLRQKLHLAGADAADDTSADFVPWHSLEPFVAHVPTARKRLQVRALRKLHPAQIADLLEAASAEEGREILGALEADPALEADVIEELDTSHRLGAVRDRSDEEIAELLAEMAPDDAVDLLGALEQERREKVLEHVPGQARATIQSLLGYHPDTAGGLMTPKVPCFPGSETAGEACAAIAAERDLPGSLSGVFVLDGSGALHGYVPLARLAAQPDASPLGEVAELDPPSVGPNADLVEVVVTMADYNLSALAVVDEEGHVLGAVTVDDVLPRLIPAGWRRRMDVLREV